MFEPATEFDAGGPESFPTIHTHYAPNRQARVPDFPTIHVYPSGPAQWPKADAEGPMRGLPRSRVDSVPCTRDAAVGVVDDVDRCRPRMTHPGAVRRAVGRWKRGTVNPASGSDCYVVATVRSLCCTVALLAVLVLALASACVPSSW